MNISLIGIIYDYEMNISLIGIIHQIMYLMYQINVDLISDDAEMFTSEVHDPYARATDA